MGDQIFASAPCSGKSLGEKSRPSLLRSEFATSLRGSSDPFLFGSAFHRGGILSSNFSIHPLSGRWILRAESSHRFSSLLRYGRCVRKSTSSLGRGFFALKSSCQADETYGRPSGSLRANRPRGIRIDGSLRNRTSSPSLSSAKTPPIYLPGGNEARTGEAPHPFPTGTEPGAAPPAPPRFSPNLRRIGGAGRCVPEKGRDPHHHGGASACRTQDPPAMNQEKGNPSIRRTTRSNSGEQTAFSFNRFSPFCQIYTDIGQMQRKRVHQGPVTTFINDTINPGIDMELKIDFLTSGSLRHRYISVIDPPRRDPSNKCLQFHRGAIFPFPHP